MKHFNEIELLNAKESMIPALEAITSMHDCVSIQYLEKNEFAEEIHEPFHLLYRSLNRQIRYILNPIHGKVLLEFTYSKVDAYLLSLENFMLPKVLIVYDRNKEPKPLKEYIKWRSDYYKKLLYQYAYGVEHADEISDKSILGFEMSEFTSTQIGFAYAALSATETLNYEGASPKLVKEKFNSFKIAINWKCIAKEKNKVLVKFNAYMKSESKSCIEVGKLGTESFLGAIKFLRNHILRNVEAIEFLKDIIQNRGQDYEDLFQERD